MTDAALGAFPMAYDPSDRMTSPNRPNPATNGIGYDTADRVGSMTTTAASTIVHSLTYGYDSRGFSSTRTDAFDTTSHPHDDRGRLAGAEHPTTSPVTDEAYTYDGAYLVAWLDGDGEEVEQNPRDAYGQRAFGPPTDVVPYGYTGHAEDPTGLVWGRARSLDPRTGTWLREDPVVEEPDDGGVWRAPVRWVGAKRLAGGRARTSVGSSGLKSEDARLACYAGAGLVTGGVTTGAGWAGHRFPAVLKSVDLFHGFESG